MSTSVTSTDNNLIFGLLALQLDFVTREQLLESMHAWMLAKHQSLGQIFCTRGVLSESDCDDLNRLVSKHIARHGGKPQGSLAALNVQQAVRQELDRLDDADVQASLVSLRSVQDEWSTRLPSSTSPGAFRYQRLRLHAKGGLGEVFVAMDQELGREVVLKEIQDRFADRPESRFRFIREAEITGRLEHPGVVPVYGMGSYLDGRPFYAMRFIRGESLQETVNRLRPGAPTADPVTHAFQVRQLLKRFLDVCNTMAYAHAHGVVHRDLKPANIMVGQFGETLVVDWGLAKAIGHPEAVAVQEETPDTAPHFSAGTAQTQPGMLLGTPAYMSPEQAAGRVEAIGPASDVYSLGAILYCLLTGRPPFQGDDLEQLLDRVQRGKFPRPREVVGTVSDALETLCLKAMALDPSERFVSAGDLAEAVERWLAEDERRRIEAEATRDALQRELAETKKSRSLYLASVGHELRTPLNHIIGYAEMLIEDFANQPSVLQDLIKIMDSAKHLRHLINDVLDHQRLVMGQFQIWPEPFSVSSAIKTACKEALAVSNVDERRVCIDCNESCGEMVSSKSCFCQIVRTLLAKQLLRCKDEASIVTVIVSGTSEEVAILLRDTGPPYNANELSRIFEPFYQTGSYVAGSTVLTGLDIIKMLCERLGGTITCESSADGGTRFLVKIRRTAPQNLHQVV